MKKWLCFIMSVMMLGLFFIGCGDKPEQSSAPNPPAQEEPEGRITDLMAAWENAGLSVEMMPDTGLKNIAVNMFYGIDGYEIQINGNPVVVMEFDLKNLNTVAQNHLDWIDDKGYNSKSNEPTWRNAEFTLSGSSAMSLDDNPDKDKIVAVFTGF